MSESPSASVSSFKTMMLVSDASSVRVSVSSTATGVSLTAVTVIVSVPVSDPPFPSEIV